MKKSAANHSFSLRLLQTFILKLNVLNIEYLLLVMKTANLPKDQCFDDILIFQCTKCNSEQANDLILIFVLDSVWLKD